MRKAFVQTLCKLAASDESILLLTGDLGYMALEPFRDAFPARFLNVGVAEQNMIGLATGLAEAGLQPYAYSIATFASLRPFEFIRNGPVAHHLPVRIIGMGAGFEYGHAGPTHYAVEDIGVLRTLPDLTIVIPADSAQAAKAIRDTSSLAGPVYYSLGKDDGSSIPGLNGRFELGRIQVIRQGTDVAIISIGSVSQEAYRAAEELRSLRIEATVAIVSNFSPDPEGDVLNLLSRFRHAISVEAQTISGGLAAFLGTAIASHGLPCRLKALGLRSSLDGTSSSQQGQWRRYGLDSSSIVEHTLAALGRN